MIPVLNADEVRAAERAAMADLPLGTLMQRAATAIAVECFDIFRQHGGIVGRRVLLLVGAGDNGGDALFAGERLLRRGVAVYAVRLGNSMHADGLRAFIGAGGRLVDTFEALALFGDLDLVIDGIVGLGSARTLTGDAALLARALSDADIFTLAIDVPSGVHTDTGAVSGVAITADLTITFGALRPAHVVVPAALHCGEVYIADIGVGMHADNLAITTDEPFFDPPAADADKYARGVVGIVTGSSQYPGAALLSVASALHSGCGMVRYFGPAVEHVVQAYPEVVPAERTAIAAAHRAQAWLVGCGFGTDDAATAALVDVLTKAEPVVIDADALTVLSMRAEARDALAQRSSRITILTPHAGEAARLAAGYGLQLDLDGDRIGAAHALARVTNSIVLLKGPSTLISDGMHFLATPLLGAQLATAGSGDVLAGLLAGALARWSAAGPVSGEAAMQLAAAAAIRHAAAALDEDTTASDLVDGLQQMH